MRDTASRCLSHPTKRGISSERRLPAQPRVPPHPGQNGQMTGTNPTVNAITMTVSGAPNRA